MKSVFLVPTCLLAAALFAPVASAAPASDAVVNDPTVTVTVKPSGIETMGKARFTVITPNLVRLEYAPEGTFTDAPTLFATQRAARCTNYEVKRVGQKLTLSTESLHLTYTDDGQPFSATNLSVAVELVPLPVRRQMSSVHQALWKPGTPNQSNLGGTLVTLDGVGGPMRLSDGVLSRDGWYLLDDSQRPTLTADWVQSPLKNGNTDWYFFGYGDNYRAALQSLTAISGNIPLPRRVALGAWYSRYWPYSSTDYRNIVKEYQQHDFPLDMMVLDMDWHRDGWTGWSWNRDLLPDAEQLLRDLHADGLGITLNLHPADGVKPHEDAYATFMRDMGADPASKQTIPFDASNKQYMDTLFRDVHDPLEREGVDFWWLDWQQQRYTRGIPELTNLQWLNHLYYEHTREDGKRGQSFSRWGGWGDQKYPIHFSGDASTGWKMLAFEVPFTSTSSNVGLFYWTHDIGGHQGGRNEESYARWCQFGALTASLRSHSTRDPETDRRPWNYPAWAEESMRRSFHLRSELFPYIYTSTRQSAAQVVPLMRPLYYDYPRVEAAYHNGQEYLFGDNLLVAPIATPGKGATRVASQVAWLPQGTWYDYFTGERTIADAQGVQKLVSADINTFPLFVRGGVPVPMQPYTPRMTTAPLSNLVVRCYPGVVGQTGQFSLYEDDGISEAYKKGSFATTALSYRALSDRAVVEIAPAKGNYKGQLTNRAYTIELPMTQPATRARVDGKTAKVSYDVARRCNVVSIPARSIKSVTRVEVWTKPIPDATLRQSALLQRLSTVSGKAVKNVSEVAPSAPVADDTATLAALGFGLALKNDAPYFYGGEDVLRFYGPNGATTLPVTVALGSASVQRNIASGMRVPMDGLSAQLSPRDQIVIPGKTALALTIPYQGRQWQISQAINEALDPSMAGLNENLARRAKVEVTSNDNEGGYDPRGVNDGLASGYPQNRRAEWATNKQTVGATLTLSWPQTVTVGRALLFDRPNLTDGVTSARITFDDGSSVDVGELPNDGTVPAELTFAPRTTKTVKITILGVLPKTENTGLGEVALFAK